MNIVIIGPGAIGSLWAYHLQQAGHQLSVWSTQDKASLPLLLDTRPAITLANNHQPSLIQADLILVTVKAWQVERALTPLKPSIAPETMLVLMHNGMGTADYLLRSFSANPLLVATTTHGAYQKTRGHTFHTGHGQTQLGALNARGAQCRFLADVLNHALPSCIWNPNIEQALWQKLAINCAINPMTAVHHIANGELAAPRFTTQLKDVVSEVAAVMNHQGFLVKADELLDSVYQVIEKTAGNYSSMHQDIHHQRRSEIEYITGYLLNMAKLGGIETPANQTLYDAIKHIETFGFEHD